MLAKLIAVLFLSSLSVQATVTRNAGGSAHAGSPASAKRHGKPLRRHAPELVDERDLGPSSQALRKRADADSSSESIKLSSDNGIGVKPLGWWLSGEDCQGSGASDCLKQVTAGKDFAGSWKEAKAPSAAKNSSSATTSRASSTHVPSSSSRPSSSSHITTTHRPSSSTHRPTTTHRASPSSSHKPSPTATSPKSTPTHTSSSGSSSGSDDGDSCPARRKRSLAQFGFSATRFEANSLTATNKLREEAGVPELKWNADLAEKAKAFAGECKWEEMSGSQGSALSAGYPNIASSLRAWTAADASQKEQVLSKDVTEMGCAVRTCDFSEQDKQEESFQVGLVKFHVCAYDVKVGA